MEICLLIYKNPFNCAVNNSTPVDSVRTEIGGTTIPHSPTLRMSNSGLTDSKREDVDRIWFCKFSRHDLHRSHAMYEEIKKKKKKKSKREDS